MEASFFQAGYRMVLDTSDRFRVVRTVGIGIMQPGRGRRIWAAPHML